jgi:predicted dehydrogenase
MMQLRIGVAGCGLIGRRHVDVVRMSSQCVLAGIADPSPAIAAVAGSVGTAHYTSIADLIAQERPDAIVIATPTQSHLADARLCADAGVHVLVEKPLADSSEAAWALVAMARAAGVVALVGHHRRYYPAVRQAREIVTGGEIGRFVGANVIWATMKSNDYFVPDWRRAPGAGPIMNNFSHEIDLLRYICGEIVEVSTLASHAVRGFAVEDSAAVLVAFADGALATALISDTAVSPWCFEMATGESRQIAYSGENTMRFVGTRGALEFPNLVMWRGHDQASLDWHHAPQASRLKSPVIDVYVEQIRHFCAVIHGEEQPIASAEEGARSIDVVRALIRAAEEGRSIRPSPPPGSAAVEPDRAAAAQAVPAADSFRRVC